MSALDFSSACARPLAKRWKAAHPARLSFDDCATANPEAPTQ